MLQVYKKTIILLGMLFCMLSIIYAIDVTDYDVSKIPSELKLNSNAIVRCNEVVFEVVSDNKAIATTKYAVTILKEGAIDLSILNINYDKLFDIKDISGIIYDSNGKKVRKIKKDEIQDHSAISGSTLFSDNRIKYIDPEYYTYPFTIEYIYSQSYNTLFFMPRWFGFEGYNVSIEHSSLKAIVPSNYKIRYWESNIKPCIVKADSDTNTYSWSIKNVKAKQYEVLSPNISMTQPTVYLAATNFELDGVKGSMETWNDLGRFMSQLLEGRDVLPEETIKEIESLVSGTDNIIDKIRIVYEYTQSKNRYISVQEGVGGWQPFTAKTVDRLSYGDCKALSNYTRALLKAIGVKSHYTRIYAGNQLPSTPDNFPMNNFNHVILCVPIENDTIWLECTSQNSPIDYMSDFTDDRYALLIKDGSGEFVKTPAYTATENQQATHSTVTLLADNSLNINARVKYSGATYGDEYYLLHKDEKDRRKKIISDISIPNFKLTNYQLNDNPSRKPYLTKSLQLTATNYCSTMGGMTILKLNLFNSFNSVPRYARNRKNPVYVQRNYSECDTISYVIPSNLAIESLPKKQELNTKYGSYLSHTENKDGKIVYYRYFQINKGTYPKEEFNDFREFLEEISIADNAKTILKQKEI
ncbi:DUF3857 domain-containing protein [Carboxylicivirga sp. N1Y90]|uniref:DUF3857 domain-containing protein n=1 Tax=Carboxylicivirga fragile TaxID=3417571 RepID=UPI003D335A2F|nr:DUF3857 domain-containing protein [Marinilabiliaceae bacterium N1Y90]